MTDTAPRSYSVKVSGNGRICIPADVRARLGWAEGQQLWLEVREDGMYLSTPEAGVERARKSVEHLFNNPEASVDNFIAERRRQARLKDEPRDAAA